MKLVQSFVIAMSMYSKIPMPRVDWKEDNMKYAMCFFPMVGIITGGCVWMVGQLLFRFSCSALFRGAVFTLLPVFISGGIHMDGFMDTMDALASYGDKEKKLAILKDTHAGAFAILGLGCYLVWSLAVWSEITPGMLGVISCVFVVSRSLSGFSVVTFPAARKSGLVKIFQDSAQKKRVRITMICFLLLAASVMLWINPVQLAGAGIGALLSFVWYGRLCKSQFGGVTGDLAGCFLEISELSMLTGVMIAGGALWN